MTDFLKTWGAFIIVTVMLIVLTPDHEPEVGDIHWGYAYGLLAASMGMVWIIMHLSTKQALWVFGLGVLPDIGLTYISYGVCGSWAFEINAYAAVYSPWVIILTSGVLLIAAIPVLRKEDGQGEVLAKILAFIRMMAIMSHPFYWFGSLTS